MIFTKKYNENFDLIFTVDKNFVKVIKTSDEIGTFNVEDGVLNQLNGQLDGELQISVDANSTLNDSLGNIYFQVTEAQA